MRALPLHDNLPPRLMSFIVNRLHPLWGRSLHAALVALTPRFGPRARLAVLAEAIEMVADALRDGSGGAMLPMDRPLPADDDTGYWARFGLAVLIEARTYPAAAQPLDAPPLSA
jgi:hypothetical protein